MTQRSLESDPKIALRDPKYKMITHRLRASPLRLMLLLLTAFVVTGVTFTSTSARAGKLESVRDRVRGKRASTKGKQSRSSRQSSRHSDTDDGYGRHGDVGDWLLAAQLMTAPWWLPRLALGDTSRRRFAYLPYPYADQHPGFVLVEGDDRPTSVIDGRPVLGDSVSLRADAEGGWLGASLLRSSIGARISGRYRFEVETRWDLFTETSGPGAVDQLWLGDVNLTWQHAVGRHGQFRAGVGVRTMVDVEGARYGVNFTYGFDLYPTDPLVIHADVDAGTVGVAGFLQMRASLGLMIGAVELYAGYDQTWVDGIDLGGPLVGLRLWR